MPGITWLGDIEKETGGGYLAKALGQGVSTGLQTYVGMKEKRKREQIEDALKRGELTLAEAKLELAKSEESGRQERSKAELGLGERKLSFEQQTAESEITIKKQQIERDYAKLDYDKRKDAYDSMVKLLPNVPPDKQAELTGSMEWTTLEESLGLPHLSGIALSPDKTKPSWGQEQEVAAVKAALAQGRGTLSQMVGEPLPKDIKTKQDALDYISLKGLDPSLFTAELARYEETPTVAPTKKGKVITDKYKVGQTIVKGGKTYTYKGNGRWSY